MNSPSNPQVALQYGPPLTLAEARVIAAAAEAEAAANGWPMAIAIADSTGHLVLLHRMDHTQHASIAVAQRKAETAVNLRRPTKVLEDALAAGPGGAKLLTVDGICAIEGGVPLVHDGRVIGGIGASGMLSTQDGQVAAAGVRACAAATAGR